MILRTKRHGCWKLATNSWGTYLRQIDDPEANAEITAEQFKSFELRTDIARLPADLWTRWVQLCFAMTEKDRRNLEVSCRLLRKEDDKSQWRILVPRQEVSGASVRVKSFDQSIDIATGEIIESYPPTGWVPCGSSHSHNTMAAFFSGTDDQYELGDPGLHIVVGSINTSKRTYAIKASITANNRRFEIPHDAVIDPAPVDGVSYHPSVLELIQLEVPKPINFGAPYSWTPKQQGKASPQRRADLWLAGRLADGAAADDADELELFSAEGESTCSNADWLELIADGIKAISANPDKDSMSDLEEISWQILDVLNDYDQQSTTKAPPDDPFFRDY